MNQKVKKFLDECKNGNTQKVSDMLRVITSRPALTNYTESNYKFLINCRGSPYNYIEDGILAASEGRHDKIIDILAPIYKITNHDDSICNRHGFDYVMHNCIDPYGYTCLIKIACVADNVFLMDYVKQRFGSLDEHHIHSYIYDTYNSHIRTSPRIYAYLHKIGISYYQKLSNTQTAMVMEYDETIDNQHVESIKKMRDIRAEKVRVIVDNIKWTDWDHKLITNIVCEYVSYEPYWKYN